MLINQFQQHHPNPIPSVGSSPNKPAGPMTNSKAQLKGSAIWTKRGEWIEESASQKIRLMVTENRQSFIAVQDEGKEKSFYERIRDYFSHVSIEIKTGDSNRKTISLNLGSLSKRTHRSILLLLLLKIRGKLTRDYIVKRVKKTEQYHLYFDRMIENGRVRAIAKGEDPNVKAEELKEVIKTVLKSRRLASGVLAIRGERVYVAFRDHNKRFNLEEKSVLLGEGTYGFVYEVLNLGTGEAQAFKIAKEDEKENGILNENKILNFIHKDGHVEGIQDAPHIVVDLLFPEYGEGYIVTKYDFNLNDIPFLKTTSMKDKLLRTKSLFHGLDWLHAHHIIHCDIKPANCCSHKGELQIADFGHVRLCDDISPELPLGVCTPYFTSMTDQIENQRINLAYSMHQIANGQVKSHIAKIKILQSAIKHPNFQIDHDAAKYTIASLLMKLSQKKLNELKIPPDFCKEEMEMLRKNPYDRWKRQLNMEKFKLTNEQLAKLKEESISLCKRHDVYGLAVSLLCIYLGVRFISPKNLDAAIKKLSNLPELALINPDLTNLLVQMMDKDGSKRPSIKAGYETYKALQKKLQVQVTT